MVTVNDIKNTREGIHLEDAIMCYENIMSEIDDFKAKMTSYALDDVVLSDDLDGVVADINGIMSDLFEFSLNVCDKYYTELEDDADVLDSVGKQKLRAY